jgi:lipoprotein NlpI
VRRRRNGHTRSRLARFRAGDFAGSLADYNRAIELRPEAARGHWRRGISCYYAGKFAEGREQFAAYQTFDDADAENALWHFLCNAKLVGAAQARREMPSVRDERRVPLMHLYGLFRGQATVDDVLAACQAPDLEPAEARARRFYADLYLGLYHVSQAQPKLALERLESAADPRNADPRNPGRGYMWDVARVHAELLLQAEGGRTKTPE